MSIELQEILNVCDLITDGTHYTPPLIENGKYCFVTVKDLKKEGIDFDNCFRISDFEYTKAFKGNSVPKVDDVLFSKDGTVGKVHTVSQEEFPFVVLSSLAIIRPSKEKVDSNYLCQMLGSKYCLNQALKLKTGSALRRIILKDLKKIKIPLPPLPIQKKIAEILDAVDALKQKDRALILKYKELTQSLFLDMFGDPVFNPKGWEKIQINKLCIEIVDCVNRTAPCVGYLTPYKMIRTSNIRNYKIDLSGAKYVTKEVYERWTRRLVPIKEDIIFTREAPVGEAAIIETEEKIFLGQRTMEYRFDKIKTNPYFMLYEIMGNNVQRQVEKLGAGSTVKHLSVPDCKKFIVNFPPIELQNEFAKRIQIIEKQKELAEASLKKSEELFQCLLQKAFRGELV